MLSPKRVKFRKVQKGRTRGLAYRGGDVSFGEFGLQSVDGGWITARQLEAGRIALTRHVKRGGKIWIRVFPQKPVTKKAAETRMGTGKGNPEFWVAVVHPGTMIYELEGVAEDVAREALRLAGHKLPISWRILKREEVVS